MSYNGQLIKFPVEGFRLSKSFWRKCRATAAIAEDERLVLEALLAEDNQLHVYVSSRLSGTLPMPAMIW